MRMVFLLLCEVLQAQFDYDHNQSFDSTCEKLTERPEAVLQGCGFTGPRGGRVNLVIVTPRQRKPPFAGVVFQHGGGQSMTNYFSEAIVLAGAGVVSLIPDAPARGEGKNSDLNRTKLEESRDFQAEVVITERRVLDLLLKQPGVDPKRVAYVGHSYGGVAGGVLSGIEPRFAAFVLIGAITSQADHIRTNASSYWKEMRDRMSPDEFNKTLELIAEIDPARFLPAARAPVLVQCARFDTDDNVAGCPEVHKLAGGLKALAWYDDDHNFTSLEALRDRLAWLEKHLQLQPVAPLLKKLLQRQLSSASYPGRK